MEQKALYIQGTYVPIHRGMGIQLLRLNLGDQYLDTLVNTNFFHLATFDQLHDEAIQTARNQRIFGNEQAWFVENYIEEKIWWILEKRLVTVKYLRQ